MPKVIFTKNVQPFKSIANNTYLMDKKFKICFDNAEIQAAYDKLLEHVCKICPGRPAFRTFNNLKDHMRKEHELYYCDLCVDNLKIFTGERRCYTRQELGQHRRKGDPDDKSHRGHPLCEFCDQRYMDNDELFRHLRRDHLFCHFCDADGYHQYYSSYDYLREHFRVDHFLCEEGSCIDEKFTSAFRTEIDLKAHRASVHGRSMGKAAAKQARTLELEFTLAPRGAGRGGRSGGAGGGGRGRPPREDEGATGPAPEESPAPPQALSRALRPSDFPSLNGAPLPAAAAPGVTVRAVRQQPLAVTDENFPALGGLEAAPAPTPVGASGGPAPARTLRLSVNSERGGDGLSIRVNRRERPSVAPPLSADDFPSLGAGGAAPGGPARWVQVDRRGRSRPTPPTSAPVRSEKRCTDEDFPRLAATERVGASSVVIPVTPTNTWLRPSAPVPAPRTVAPLDAMSGPAAPVVKVKSKKKKQQPLPGPTKSGVDGVSKDAGKRKKRDDQPPAGSNSTPRSGEEEITSKLEGILMSRDSADERRRPTAATASGSCNSVSSNTSSRSSAHTAGTDTAASDRKRSELLIGALQGGYPSTPSAAANATSAGGGCPPGFSRVAPMAPPPGFAGPPPGFSSVTLNSVARPSSMTFTSSSGRSYAIPAAPAPALSGSRTTSVMGVFVAPHDAERRNQELVEKVREVVPIDDFLQLSAQFRRGKMHASAFYSGCRRLLGDAFPEVFPELLALLPDIAKQQELLCAHESVSGAPLSLEACGACGQLLLPSDLPHHRAAHKQTLNGGDTAPR